MAKPPVIEGSRSGLEWSTAAFVAGVAAQCRSRAALGYRLLRWSLSVWRLLAASRSLRLPGTFAQERDGTCAGRGVVVRFHTLNGLSAGTALLLLMGGVKLLETRTQRDQFIVVGAAVFLLLAACLDRQSLLRAPLYLLQAWLCCAALAVVSYAPEHVIDGNTGGVRQSRRHGARCAQPGVFAAAGDPVVYLLSAVARCVLGDSPLRRGAHWPERHHDPGQHLAADELVRCCLQGALRRPAAAATRALLARPGASRIRRLHLETRSPEASFAWTRCSISALNITIASHSSPAHSAGGSRWTPPRARPGPRPSSPTTIS